MWGTVLSFVLGLGKDVAADWQQAREDKRAIKRATTENKIRLAKQRASHNQQWEMSALEGRDSLLRRFSFALFTFPLLWSGIDPQGAQEYFTVALAALPEWYIQTYMAMMAVIWGIAELKQWKS